MQINTVGGECYGGRGAEEEGGQHEHGDGGHGAASPLVPPAAAAANLVHGGGEGGVLAFLGRLWLVWEVLKRVEWSGVWEKSALAGSRYAELCYRIIFYT